MHNNRNNRDYSSDYNRTNKIYNRCIPSALHFEMCSYILLSALVYLCSKNKFKYIYNI